MKWRSVISDLLINVRNKDVVHGPEGPETKWIIVGTGYMARTFGRAINGTRGNRVVCICSRSRYKAWKMSLTFRGSKYTDNLERTIKETGQEIDVVYIATPLETHLGYMEVCSRLGVNVLCEKPIVKNSVDFRKLNACSKTTSEPFIIEAMWLYFLPTLEYLVSNLPNNSSNNDRNLHVVFSRKSKTGANPWEDFGPYAVAITQKVLGGDLKITSCEGDMNSASVHLRGELGTASIEISNTRERPVICSIQTEEKVYELNHPFNRTNILTEYDVKSTIKTEHKFHYTFEGFEYQVMKVSEILRLNDRKLVNDLLALSMHRTELIDRIKTTLL